MKRLQLTTEKQVEAFENAMDAVDAHDRDDFVDVDRNERGRNAGEVRYGEVVRVLAEAYTGAIYESES